MPIQRFYIGGEGIYTGCLDTLSGALTAPKEVFSGICPLYMTAHPQGQFLYAVEANRSEENGRVYSFAADPNTGKLRHLNNVSSGGKVPCYISMNRSGTCAYVANYSSGSVASFAVQADGRLCDLGSAKQYEGFGPHPRRQESPHPHAIVPSACNRYVYVVDLGLDQIAAQPIDPQKGILEPKTSFAVSLKGESGPRQLKIHPSGRYAYVISELSNTITACAVDSSEGILSEIQTIRCIPDEYKGDSYASEVCIHPSGNYLYAANRGHDSIAAFHIDSTTGRLDLTEISSCGGQWPQQIMIDLTGRWMLSTNMRSDSVTVFEIREQGRLMAAKQVIELPKPSCIAAHKILSFSNGSAVTDKQAVIKVN